MALTVLRDVARRAGLVTVAQDVPESVARDVQCQDALGISTEELSQAEGQRAD